MTAAGPEATDGETVTVPDGTTVATDAPAADADVCTADKEGGEVKMSILGTAPNLDTYTARGGSVSNSYELLAMYDTLIRYDLASGKFVPHVAESITPNADSSVWTLKLRPEVTFGNGDPLNADAMIAHLDRHLGEGSTSVLLFQKQFIKSYTKLDEWSVEFTLNAPWGNFPAVFTPGSNKGLGMVENTKVVDAMGQEAFSKFPKGAGVGPFEIESWAPPEGTVFVAKDNWWGGPVCIKKLTVSLIPGVDAAYQAFQNGEVQTVSMNRDPVTLAQAKLDHPDTYGGNLLHNAFMAMPNISVKGYNGPFSDVRVRQAMAYAIDADVVNDRAFSGEGKPWKGIVDPEAANVKGTEGLEYDPEKAKALLDEYKAETGWDGSVTALCATTPAPNLEAGITIAAQMEAVGFKVDLQQQTVQQIISQVSIDQNFELALCWGTPIDEANIFTAARGFDSRNTRNQNGFSSPDYDAALDQLQAAQTPEEYQAGLDAVQKAWNEGVPGVSFGADEVATFYADNVKGIIWELGWEPLWDKAYLEK